MSKAVYNGLKYHNHFVLGPSRIEALDTWRKTKISDSIHLMTHPDLNTCQVNDGPRSITLTGFILDPADPHASDADILADLAPVLGSSNDFAKHTGKYGGRWVLIVNDGRSIRLYTDTVGLRQVFYTSHGHGGDVWCASQPGMIAQILGLEMEPAAVDFIDSHEFRCNPEFRWPGDSTPYKEVKHLLPNHYLDLVDGRSKRYWPEGPLPQLSLDEAVERVAPMLSGLMTSAANRFDLSLSITAGMDSRLVLAAAREIKDRISYMTVRQIGMPDDHPDVAVPSQLLSNLGLKHDVVKSSLLIDDEFLAIFKKNVPVAHYVYAPDAQAILRYYAQKKVAVTGSASEVARSSFRAIRNNPRNEDITIEHLANAQEIGNQTFAVDHYKQWWAGLGDIYNLHILSLFEWELDDGNWLAMCQLEFDAAWKDIFTPFNCRDLIVTMLSVDPMYTMAPKYELYQTLIGKLWPEVLDTPVNPHKNYKRSLASKVKSYTRRQLNRWF
jgi:hypothetical protein